MTIDQAKPKFKVGDIVKTKLNDIGKITDIIEGTGGYYDKEYPYHIEGLSGAFSADFLELLEESPINELITAEDLVKEAIDSVNHPSHYNKGKFEVIDVIEDWKLGFHAGNAVKYIARAEHKENREQDIKKALWYLNRLLEKWAKETNG